MLSWGVPLLLALACGHGPTVDVPSLGRLEGREADNVRGVALFRGIPYGKPPVGELRWRPPQPHGPWASPRLASDFQPACIPYYTSPNVSVSEDCLFLNVAAPISGMTESMQKRPVMAYMHGGSYRSGAAANAQPEALVASSSSEVLVVTIDFRLNIFGHLASDVLRDRSSDGSTGNYGLDDQRLAFRWVRDHIGAFGGDGSALTIFGQSAGGNNVLNHLVQRPSFALYDRAIVQSGTYLTAFSMDVAEIIFKDYLTRTSCADLSCLLNTSAEVLADLVAEGKESWGPAIDGVLLTSFPQQMIAHGEYNSGVPVLLGSARDEYAYVHATSLAANLTEEQFDGLLASSVWAPNATDIKELYSADAYDYPADLGEYSQSWWKAMRLATDGGLSRTAGQPTMGLGHCSLRCVARLLRRGGSQDVFAYSFDHASQEVLTDRNVGTPLGGTFPGSPVAPHASDCNYVIGVPSELDAEVGEVDLSSAVSDYFASFAKHGNPNTQGLPAWPQYEADVDRILSLDVGSGGIRPLERSREAQCDFFDQQAFSVCSAPPVGESVVA